MNLKISFLLSIMFGFSFLSKAQVNNHQIECLNPDFSHQIDRYIDYDIPVISVDSLYPCQDDYLILDVREYKEYRTSHISNALHIGYKKPNFDLLKDTPKDQLILVYCSIGYRSEKLGVKLKKKGFTNVFNLYGSIFEWVNHQYPVLGIDGVENNKIHTYNKKWSKWIDNPTFEKVF